MRLEVDVINIYVSEYDIMRTSATGWNFIWCFFIFGTLVDTYQMIKDQATRWRLKLVSFIDNTDHSLMWVLKLKMPI